jgi:hypothetical protein
MCGCRSRIRPAPSHVSAVMSGAMTKVALYVIARCVFDLMGPAQPFWIGAPLVVLGAASAVIGALRANLEDDTKTLLACSTIENVGLVAIGLGLALAFRGADLPALAALAAAAALLHALNHAVFKTLLFLAAGEVLHGAGVARDRPAGRPGAAHAGHGLGGAGGGGGCGGAAAALGLCLGMAAAAGFAGGVAGRRPGLPRWARRAATAVAALATALAAAAMVRFWGLVFLGRPRTPRAAGAAEDAGLARWALLIPAGLTVVLGLLPGVALDLAEPALRLMAGAAAPRAGMLVVGAAEGGARYWPLLVAVLLAAAVGAVLWVVRRRAPSGGGARTGLGLRIHRRAGASALRRPGLAAHGGRLRAAAAADAGRVAAGGAGGRDHATARIDGARAAGCRFRRPRAGGAGRPAAPLARCAGRAGRTAARPVDPAMPRPDLRRGGADAGIARPAGAGLRWRWSGASWRRRCTSR